MRAETDSQALLGVIFLLTSTVALSGALVIDGIRYYSTSLIRQMDWIVKRSHYFGTGDNDESPHNRVLGNPGEQHRYRVVGRDASGKTSELIIQAGDQTAALRTGEKAGLEVSKVERLT